MILTYKIKHGKDFSEKLRKAKKVAEYAIQTHSRSSKDVKQFGLKSIISNQGIKVDHGTRTIFAPCIKLSLRYESPDNFEKVNQIEVGEEYAYISVSIPETGKVLKLGKAALHVHQKYKNMRKDLQHKGKYGKVKQIKDRESRIVRDTNHNVSRKIVNTAKESGKGIKLEDLTGIRNGKNKAKSFRYAKNSWSFYQLQTMVEYKAKLLGVEVAYVDPAYTSKTCSRCGHIGDRNGKSFKCPNCGHVDHADSNAGFNIAKRPCIDRSTKERDLVEGTTDSPKVALA